MSDDDEFRVGDGFPEISRKLGLASKRLNSLSERVEEHISYLAQEKKRLSPLEGILHDKPAEKHSDDTHSVGSDKPYRSR